MRPDPPAAMSLIPERTERTPPARCLVVVNPVSRRGADSLLDHLRERMPAETRLSIVETTTTPLERGALEAAAREADLVVAVGGDGTVAETLTAMDRASTPVGIIAGGSTNIIALELGIPADPAAAAALLFGEHRVIEMDAATCNGETFLHMAGAGFDSRIFDNTSRRQKQRFGWLAYLPSAAHSLRLPPARFAVTTDDAAFEITSPMVIVANGAGIIRPELPIYPGIAYDDGLLDLIAVTATAPSDIATVLARFVTRRMRDSPHILHARSRSIRIEADPVIPIQLDGNVSGATPATIELRDQRARMIVPSTGAGWLAGRGGLGREGRSRAARRWGR